MIPLLALALLLPAQLGDASASTVTPAAVALLSVAPSDESGAGAADTPATLAEIRAGLDRAVGFLLSIQAEDGGWGSPAQPRTDLVVDPATHAAWRRATTGLVCRALLLAPELDAGLSARAGAAARAGLELLGEDAGATGADRWADVYVLAALVAALEDPHGRLASARSAAGSAAGASLEPTDVWRGRAERAVAALVQGAATSGGWAGFDPGARRLVVGSAVTAAALVALQDARAAGVPVPEPTLRAGLDALERARLADGGFAADLSPAQRSASAVGRDTLKGSLARTQAAHLALWHADPPRVDERDVLIGLDAFFAHHRFLDLARGRPDPGSGFYESSGYAFLFGHAYAGRLVARLNPAGRARYASRLAREVLAIQEPSGALWDFPLFAYDRAYGTAFGVLTLTGALP